MKKCTVMTGGAGEKNITSRANQPLIVCRTSSYFPTGYDACAKVVGDSSDGDFLPLSTTMQLSFARLDAADQTLRMFHIEKNKKH